MPPAPANQTTASSALVHPPPAAPPLTPELARQLNLRTAEGVIVFSVDEESAASEAGLQRGDVIREVNRQRVRNLQDFERVTKDVKEGDRVTVLLQRGQQSLYVAFTISRG